MTTAWKIAVTAALILVLGGLGAADYYYGGDISGQLIGNDDEEIPDGAVAKNPGPIVNDVIVAQAMTTQTSDELTLLKQLVTDGTSVESYILLKDGDRAGSVTWVETPKVKDYFASLKDALLTSFSPEMRDLRDETIQEEGKPVRNLLTFFDPVLSEERIVFVRVRERIFEFHIAAGKDDAMNSLIEALTAN